MVILFSKRGVFLANELNEEKNTKEEEGIMAAVAKPNTRAFVLRADKVDQFVKKNDASRKAVERFHAHRPKDGVVTPLKGKDE